MATIVYLKGDKNVEVTHSDITLGDILTMECVDKHVLAKLKSLRVLKVTEKNRGRNVISILKIVECIHKEYPNLEIQNLGESDIIITCENQETSNQVMHLLKIALVAIIVFIGSAFSIMAFNNDIDAPKLFSQIFEQTTGQQKEGYGILELTYCVGVSMGILVFFNHVGKKKLTVDPTPMEVEMRLYENDIQATLIETYARKKEEMDVD